MKAPAKVNTIPVTYVSGKGNDSGDCSSPAKPCRTFQFAVNQTLPGGEVKALDPADYSPVTIHKSISITGVEGDGIDTKGGNAISLNPLSNATINLADLVIQNVSGSGSAGISGSSDPGVTLTLTVRHCTVRGFSIGIFLTAPLSANNRQFLIADTIVTNNKTGFVVGLWEGTLDHVIVSQNQNGLLVSRAAITAVDTIVSDNLGTGFDVNGSVSFLLAHSTVTRNGTGVSAFFQASAFSFGDNHIKGNGTDVMGTLTKIGTQ